MLRSRFLQKHVAEICLPVLLRFLLKNGLCVVKVLLSFDIVQDKAIDVGPRRCEAAVQINGADHCLHGVGNDAGAESAAGLIFPAAQAQEFSQGDLFRAERQGRLTHKACPLYRQLPFREFRVAVIEKLRAHQLEHRISQELEPFIAACSAFFVFISI